MTVYAKTKPEALALVRDNPEAVRGRPVYAIDPGVSGAVVYTPFGYPPVAYPMSGRVRPAGLPLARGAVVVIEGQYIGFNPAAAIDLAWSAGWAAGVVCPDPSAIVIVAPSVWQAAILGRGRPRVRKDLTQATILKAASLGVLPEKKAQREGAASALCIYEWWRQLAGGTGDKHE